MEEIIAQARRLKLWRPLDVQFSRMLATSSQKALMLASACLSSDVGAGHVCLPLAILTPEQLFGGRYPNLAMHAWQRAGSPSLAEWQQLLLASSGVVSDGSRPVPLVLDNQRLYLHRIWQYECIVAKFFSYPSFHSCYEETRIVEILNHLFPKDNTEINWQKIAVAVAITHPIALIVGGPGTGKTSTVAKLLAALLMLSDGERLRIIMTAPTGKAASRLTKSFSLELQHIELDDSKKQQLPRQAITLHQLLGALPNRQFMRYHCDNQLRVDVLIIDESSMIDLPMMAHVITALPPQARVIFLGDHCQLSSVGAGAVLGDICQLAETGYSSPRQRELSRLTGYILPNSSTKSKYRLANSLCLLRKSYRFDDCSGINQLASAIKAGDRDRTLAFLNAKIDRNICYFPMREYKDYQQMINSCVAGYRDYLQYVQYKKETPTAIFNMFSRYQLLCAIREGPFGVVELNLRIEQALSQAGLIKINSSRNYVGRPIMVLRNSPLQGLSNGDTGILLFDDTQQILRAYFTLPDGNVKTLSLSCLPEHETAFAITVHKSQGSEFSHVMLVLPHKNLSILTRELLYTAVTRTRQHLSIYATDSVIAHAIVHCTQRRSGLSDRLMLLMSC